MSRDSEKGANRNLASGWSGRPIWHLMATVLAPMTLVLTLAACSDEGDTIQNPGPGPGLELELDLLPVRTVIGDTLRILGGDFGAEAGARRVVFTGGGSAEVDATVLS